MLKISETKYDIKELLNFTWSLSEFRDKIDDLIHVYGENALFDIDAGWPIRIVVREELI